MSSVPPLEFDARPLFATGKPPLVPILNAVNRLATGQAFRLIAPIEPRPLMQMLSQRGFTAESRARDDGTWEIVFTPIDATEPGPDRNDLKSRVKSDT